MASYSPEQRRAAIQLYEAARARGLGMPEAAKASGVSLSTLEAWGGDDGSPETQIQIAKVRRCLWCGCDFKSTWAGNRRCCPCRGDRNPDALGALWE